MKISHLPNLITILRILIILPLCFALIGQNYSLSLILFAVAALSDGVDGFLARRFHWQSQLGAFLDPLADKLIILVTTWLLAWQHHLLWAAAIVFIARDIIIILGAICYRFFVGQIIFKPTFLSKINTVLQLVLIVMILVNIALGSLFSTNILLLSTYATLIMTLISGVDYVMRWSLRAYSAKKGLAK